MSASWEVQKVLYDKLKANSTFMNLISSLSDEPPTNQTQPYVVVGDAIENTDNTICKNGYEVIQFFKIYTKPGKLGFYPAKQIYIAMNNVLNMKKFTLSGNLYMINCKLDNMQTIRKDDIRQITARYQVLVGDRSNLNIDQTS